MDMKERIEKLGEDFDKTFSPDATENIRILKELVEAHGYDNVALASGFKVSTLIQLTKGWNKYVARDKVARAKYIFDNLKSE